MHYREILLTLWIFTFSRISGHCITRQHINALEGEFFSLKFCSSLSQNELSNVKWYKKNESLGLVELSSSNSSRIILRNKSLEFWPLELGDSGSYKFSTGNVTQNWTLNVSRRSNQGCYSENITHSQSVENGQYLSIPCDEVYENFTISTSLYKDCEKIKSGKSFIDKSAEYEDHGYYTCVYTLHHNGKPFNFTKTYKITITKGPPLPGPCSCFRGMGDQMTQPGRGRDCVLEDLSSEVPSQKQQNKIQTWQRATVCKILRRGKEPHSFWPGAACGLRAACSPLLFYYNYKLFSFAVVKKC